MNRRDIAQITVMAAANLTLRAQPASRAFQSGYVGKNRIYYEVHGNPKDKPLFLGFPIFASYAQIFGARQAGVLNGFLERLTDRYRVLVADYPSIGKSGTTPATELTADRVSADLLSVADAAGFKRFAYWRYAWGAAAGLQMASRTKRLSALVIGGWPPPGDHRTGGARISRQGNLNAIRTEKPYGRIPIRPADHSPRIFPG